MFVHMFIYMFIHMFIQVFTQMITEILTSSPVSNYEIYYIPQAWDDFMPFREPLWFAQSLVYHLVLVRV